MGEQSSVGFTMRSDRRRGAYPRTPGAVASCACRCLRRDVDRSVLHVAAAGAWKESLTEGSRSRRPGPAGSGEAPAMVAEPLPVKGLKARPARFQQWGGAGKPKIGSGQKSPSTRAPHGDPGDPQGPGEPPTRGSRGGPAGSPGAGGQPAPGLPKRHPRTRRTSGLQHHGRRQRTARAPKIEQANRKPNA